jgi:integrase
MAALTAATLTSNAISAYRDQRLLTVKPGTVRRELVILHHLFEVATKEWGVCQGRNPVASITRPIAHDQRDRRLNDDEWARLEVALSRARNPYLGAAAAFALATGMRRGEILALQWPDVNFHTRVATVRLSKNGRSRTVPLSTEALDILQPLCRTNAKVFGISADALRNGWSRACRSVGIENLRFHDLRHEAISRFFERGLSLAEVCHISGHRDLRMLSRYTHLRATDIAAKLR